VRVAASACRRVNQQTIPDVNPMTERGQLVAVEQGTKAVANGGKQYKQKKQSARPTATKRTAVQGRTTRQCKVPRSHSDAQSTPTMVSETDTDVSRPRRRSTPPPPIDAHRSGVPPIHPTPRPRVSARQGAASGTAQTVGVAGQTGAARPPPASGQCAQHTPPRPPPATAVGSGTPARRAAVHSTPTAATDRLRQGLERVRGGEGGGEGGGGNVGGSTNRRRDGVRCRPAH